MNALSSCGRQHVSVSMNELNTNLEDVVAMDEQQ